VRGEIRQVAEAVAGVDEKLDRHVARLDEKIDRGSAETQAMIKSGNDRLDLIESDQGIRRRRW
jgi:hypothetical protein